MTYEEITDQFREKREAAQKLKNELRARADAAKAKALQLQGKAARQMTRYHALSDEIVSSTHVSWVDNVVVPLVKEVNRRTGLAFDTEDRRTYGLRAECPVFHDTTDKDGNRKQMNLTFTPSFQNDTFQLYLDTGKTDNRYASDSIGSLNGMNNITQEIHSVEDVINNLRERFPKYFPDN